MAFRFMTCVESGFGPCEKHACPLSLAFFSSSAGWDIDMVVGLE